MRALHTSINFALFHVLSRHSVGTNDFGQRRCLKIFLARLLLGLMFTRILLHAFQVIGPSSKVINIVPLLEELAGLFAHFQHPVGWVPQHLDDARDLIVLRGSRK